MKRRNFFGWLGMSWFASLLPMAIAACSSQKAESPSPSGAVPSDSKAPSSPPRSDGFIAVGTVAALDQTGLFKAKISGTSVGILRDTTKPSALRALSLSCTHQGCIVDWQPADKTFKCPCHAASFDADGKVLQGPANKPLPLYAAKLEGNNILVKVS